MTKKPDPKHGITGCAVGQEDVAILMDYIIDQEPQKGLVHKNDTASEDQSVRDADVYFRRPRCRTHLQVAQQNRQHGQQILQLRDLWH